ncbi:MAG TPA: hypothetical protein VFG20_19610, partial [Planctomycetaceae bacterium]|nr:hypothetical protein [Planctomycetaceae bacterium]
FQHDLAPVATCAEAWLGAIRALGHAPKSTRLVLPARNPAGQWVRLEETLSWFPDSLMNVRDAALQQSLRVRCRQLMTSTAGTPPECMRKLSELAAEVASFRVLLTAADSFEVTGRSVLTMVALINGLQFLNEWKQQPAQNRKTIQGWTNAVRWPLRLGDTDFPDHRPGDFWLADLAARTFREGTRALTQNFQHQASVKILGPLVLEFATRSTLHKLLEGESLGKLFLPHLKYDEWPGFETIVEDSAANSLRRVIATELVGQVVERPDGPSGVALLRLLGRLPQLPPRSIWASRLFLAELLWELLEGDPQLLKKLLANQQVTTALFQVMPMLRDWKLDDPTPEQMPLRNRLADVMACLESYEQFRHLQTLMDVGRPVTTSRREAAVPLNS